MAAWSLLSILLISLALPISVAKAELADLQTSSQRCIREIFDRLQSQKAQAPVLSEFGQDNLKVDDLGWPYIEYTKKASGSMPDFYLLIRALPAMATDSRTQLPGYREYIDSFLGVKFTVYVKSAGSLRGIDPYDIVQSALRSLYPAETEKYPLRLDIVPDRSFFKVGDRVTFDLILSNEGDMALKVRKMDPGAVLCYFNGLSWGATTTSDERVSLMPGEETRTKLWFVAQKAGDVEIRCTYGLRFMGDQPSAKTVVNIR